jgi:hypothetical protein
MARVGGRRAANLGDCSKQWSGRVRLAEASPTKTRAWPTRKHTEPVTPPSGFPTDRRLTPTAYRRTINLGRSVLGASRNLCAAAEGVKRAGDAPAAICVLFFSHPVKLRSSLLALSRSGRKRAGPVGPATNSPSRERFRPPSRRAFRFRVRLLGGLRPTGAPCSAQAGLLQMETRPSRPSRNEFRAICDELCLGLRE